MYATNKSIEQCISIEKFNKRNIKLFMKRDDLIDLEVSGNKWRKLKYNIEHVLQHKLQGVLTFGGAYSNHLLATASACQKFNLKSIAIVRGEELEKESNWVLKRCGYRFLQTAWAFDIRDKAAAYKAVKIPLNQGQPGDIALWSYGHVNFIYTASSGTYSFVGGNQSSAAKNVNNPSSGSVTRSWPSGYRTPGDNSLIGIWRPVKE